MSSGQICSRFLRTCLSSIIVEILTIQKADPFPFFYRTLVTPPQKKKFILKKGKTFELCWDRTQYSYVSTNSDLKSSTLTTRPIVDVSNLSFSLAVQGSGRGLRKISFFLLGGFPLYFEAGIGMGANMGALFMKRHTTTQFCSLLPLSLGVRTMMSTKYGK